jgi:hypothetical protein
MTSGMAHNKGAQMLNKGLAALAAAAVCALSVSAAVAQDDTTADRTEKLLRGLLAERNKSAKAPATESRSASIKLEVRINKESSFSLPMRCYFSINHENGIGNYYDESKDAEAEFKNDVGTCDVRIPFHWAMANPANPVEIYAYFDNEPDGGRDLKAAGAPTYRSSGRDLNDIPLPGEGEVVVVKVNVDM